jgi:hypothetical protein
VAELVAAGEVLKGERDALLKLIQVCSLGCSVMRVIGWVCVWHCAWVG